ncbi:MAG: hypothetical protein H7144_07070 [Burkholderiales bacterium]|nr:hypothetical protein [Phycisphaerae bacterium]
MTTRISTPTGIISRAPTPADADMTVIQSSNPELVAPGTTTSIQVDHALLLRHTSATRKTGYILDVHLSGSLVPTGSIITIENLTPEIASISNNVVSHVSDGEAIINLFTRYTGRELHLTMDTKGGLTIDEFVGYEAGSAPGANQDEISAILPTTGLNQEIFSAYNVRSTSFVGRNISNIHALMSSSSREENGGTNRAWMRWTPVAPDIVLCAAHYFPGPSPLQYNRAAGIRPQWRTSDNTLVEREIIASKQDIFVNDIDMSINDIIVAKLDSDLPESIGILPCILDSSDFGTVQYGLTVLLFDQRQKLYTATLSDFDRAMELLSSTVSSLYSTYTKLSYFNGDSGSPICLLLDNTLVLVKMVSSNNIKPYQSWINATMYELGSPYQLTGYSYSP